MQSRLKPKSPSGQRASGRRNYKYKMSRGSQCRCFTSMLIYPKDSDVSVLFGLCDTRSYSDSRDHIQTGIIYQKIDMYLQVGEGGAMCPLRLYASWVKFLTVQIYYRKEKKLCAEMSALMSNYKVQYEGFHGKKYF